MVSTAIWRAPAATRSGVMPGAAAAMAVASSEKRCRTASPSAGWSAVGPKTAGRAAIGSRPSSKLASVIVAGPPRR